MGTNRTGSLERRSERGHGGEKVEQYWLGVLQESPKAKKGAGAGVGLLKEQTGQTLCALSVCVCTSVG